MANIAAFCDLLESKFSSVDDDDDDDRTDCGAAGGEDGSSSAAVVQQSHLATTPGHDGQGRQEAEQQQWQPCSSSSTLVPDRFNDDAVEELHGTVLLGPDGQFYVQLNTATNLTDDPIDLEQFKNIFVYTNEADVAQTLVFDDTDQRRGRRASNDLLMETRTEHQPQQQQQQQSTDAADEVTDGGGGGGGGGGGNVQPTTSSADQQDSSSGHEMAQTELSFVHHQARTDCHFYSAIVSPDDEYSADDDTNDYNNASTVDEQQQQQIQHQRHFMAPATMFDEGVAQEEVVECEPEEGEEGTVGAYGFKHRRSRVFGGCRCFECGQTFVNMARLERHLSVHQQYGLYLCPLCGKTYKYEYNLFFHWRKTCRDMNELLSQNELRAIEINTLRQLVDEIAQKKMTIGPLALDDAATAPSSACWPSSRRLPPPILRQSVNPKQQQPPPQQQHNKQHQHKTLADKMFASKLTMSNMFGDKLATCSLCGLTVYDKHLATHRAVHRGEQPVDGRSVGGAFFCNLCGLMFRTQATLVRHWRTGCGTIHADLQTNCDDNIAMDDVGLKQMVADLLNKLTQQKGSKPGDDRQPSTFRQAQAVAAICSSTTTTSAPSASAVMFDAGQVQQQQQQQSLQTVDEEWARSEGIFFADDFFDVDIAADGNGESTNDGGGGGTLLLLTEDGRLVNTEQRWRHCAQLPPPTKTVGRRIVPTKSSPTTPPPVAVIVPTQRHQQHPQYNHYHHHHYPQGEVVQAVRATDNYDGFADLQCIQYAQSVQCSECYRSFSSVQRLEKHMAGTHCSFGTHHCLLCGSRFKYEYNLLFHYRQVCPYTLKVISDEQRQQLEAVDLKKTVRRIASSTSFAPNIISPRTLPHHHHAMPSSSGMPLTGGGPSSFSASACIDVGGVGAGHSSATIQQQQQHQTTTSSLLSSSYLAQLFNKTVAATKTASKMVSSVNTAGHSSSSSSSDVDDGHHSSTNGTPVIVPIAAAADCNEFMTTAMPFSGSAALGCAAPSSSRPELGDSMVRRQMMKKIIQRHRRQQSASSSSVISALPQQLLQPVVRPDLPDGSQCPICSIVFYGLKVLVRHLRAAHPNESSVWERTLSALGSPGDGTTAAGAVAPSLGTAPKLCPSRVSTQRKRKTLHDEGEEQPPHLELAGQIDSPTTTTQRQTEPSSMGIE